MPLRDLPEVVRMISGAMSTALTLLLLSPSLTSLEIY